MTNCRDCGEPIQFLEGDRRPYDLTPRVHYANPLHQAAMREKNGAKPKKAKREPAKELAPAEAMLKEMGYPDYAELLRGIPEGVPEDMVLAALKRKGE